MNTLEIYVLVIGLLNVAVGLLALMLRYSKNPTAPSPFLILLCLGLGLGCVLKAVTG